MKFPIFPPAATSVAILSFALALASRAQESSSWSYEFKPDLDAPPRLLDQVPGRGLVGALADGLGASTGVSWSYDDNLYQINDDTVGASVLTSDLSLYYRLGTHKRRGVFYGLDYSLAYFRYEDEALSRGRDPFEHGYSGFVGVRGTKTTVTLSGQGSVDNGNAINQQLIQRETLRSESVNYSGSLNVSHRIRRDTISLGTNYQARRFSETDSALADLDSFRANLSLQHRPQATPKTSVNLSVSYGSSDQDAGVKQQNIAPTIGVNYRYSPKTSFFASAGVDFRHTESETALVTPATLAIDGTVISPEKTTLLRNDYDQRTPIYSLGASWEPDVRTSVSLGLNRSVSASALRGQSSSKSTSVDLTGTRQLSKGYYAAMNYGYEIADYGGGSGNGEQGRSESEGYHRFGASLGRQIELRPGVSLTVSGFYQFNARSADDQVDEFQQSITGIRLGLSF